MMTPETKRELLLLSIILFYNRSFIPVKEHNSEIFTNRGGRILKKMV